MESNWRWNIAASGLTPWAFDVSTGIGYKWKFLAKLTVPFYVGPFLIEAVGQIQMDGYTQLVFFPLFAGTYPEGPITAGSGINVIFPGIYDVVPDSPAVPWD